MCTGGICDGMAMCVECLADADCGGMTPLCDTMSNTCVACLAEGDCGDENDCTGDVCTDGACSNPSLDAGTMCAGGVCDGMAMCVECLADADCGGMTPLCNTMSNTCVACLAEGDCGDENECTGDVCTDGACSNPPLDAGTMCTGGVCNDLAVCVECLTDADCADGLTCSDDNLCVQPPMPDAGPPPADASLQVVVEAGGCGCSVPTSGRTPHTPLLALGVFGLLMLVRRRRR
jgi:MYXO-CTERM domain-containing protein